MADECGKTHLSDCECTYVCPECGAAVEESYYDCECGADDCFDEGHDLYRCIGCDAVFRERTSLGNTKAMAVEIERKKLAEWSAWAKGAAS